MTVQFIGCNRLMDSIEMNASRKSGKSHGDWIQGAVIAVIDKKIQKI